MASLVKGGRKEIAPKIDAVGQEISEIQESLQSRPRYRSQLDEADTEDKSHKRSLETRKKQLVQEEKQLENMYNDRVRMTRSRLDRMKLKHKEPETKQADVSTSPMESQGTTEKTV
jgi:organic radical activating enzyme